MNRIVVIAVLAVLSWCLVGAVAVGAVELARWSADWLAGAVR